MRDAYRRQYETHAKLSLFLRRRARALDRIRRFLELSKAPYVGWSGGKDSLAVLVLLRALGRTDVAVFTQADDLDWPAKERFCVEAVERLGFTDYEYRRSDVSALDQLAALTLGVDQDIRGTFSHVIDRYVADRDRDGVILGLRAEESPGRAALAKYRGAVYRTKDGLWHCIPIADWSAVDVFALLVSEGVPHFGLYDHDDECPPHEIRMSWMLNPRFLDRGAAAFLRRHYPEDYRRLAMRAPDLRRFT